MAELVPKGIEAPAETNRSVRIVSETKTSLTRVGRVLACDICWLAPPVGGQRQFRATRTYNNYYQTKYSKADLGRHADRISERLRRRELRDCSNTHKANYGLGSRAVYLVASFEESFKELAKTCRSSIGKIYLVDGLAPKAFRVSRYCSTIVLESMPLAAAKMVFRAPA